MLTNWEMSFVDCVNRAVCDRALSRFRHIVLFPYECPLVRNKRTIAR